MQDKSQPGPHLTLFRALIGLSLVSTTIHYAHNFFEASSYPPVPIFTTPLAYQIGVAIAFPIATFAILKALRDYKNGRLKSAAILCIGYAPLGMTSVLHFLGGTPDVPWPFFTTMFTDAITGTAILTFGLVTLDDARDRRRANTSAPVPAAA